MIIIIIAILLKSYRWILLNSSTFYDGFTQYTPHLRRYQEMKKFAQQLSVVNIYFCCWL